MSFKSSRRRSSRNLIHVSSDDSNYEASSRTSSLISRRNKRNRRRPCNGKISYKVKPIIGWEDDGVNGGPSSIKILLDWIITPGNYDRWRDYFNLGERKRSILKEILSALRTKGIRNRSLQAVNKRFDRLETSFDAATDFFSKLSGGSSKRNIERGSRHQCCRVKEGCKYYEVLRKVMGSRGRCIREESSDDSIPEASYDSDESDEIEIVSSANTEGSTGKSRSSRYSTSSETVYSETDQRKSSPDEYSEERKYGGRRTRNDFVGISEREVKLEESRVKNEEIKIRAQLAQAQANLIGSLERNGFSKDEIESRLIRSDLFE